MTLAAPAAPLQLALFTAADVVVDEPTVQQAMRLMADLRGICVGDVWQSGEYRVERDDVTGCDTVRFLRGAHVRGEWVVGDDGGETSPNKLAAALKAIHAELVGTGITTGWLREGLLCEDADEGCENLCYDAFEKFIQEALWEQKPKANCTRAANSTSFRGTSSSMGITRRSAARNSLTGISPALARRYSTRSATMRSGATCGGSDYRTRKCVHVGRTKAHPGSRKTSSPRTRARRTDLTATAGNVAPTSPLRVGSRNWRSRAKRFAPGIGRTGHPNDVRTGKAHAPLNKMNRWMHADF